MLGGCCSICVDACFNFPFHVIPAAMVFWLFVGGLAQMGGGIPMFDKPRMRRHKAALVAAACLAFILGGFISVPALRADRFYARGIYYLGANMWEMSAAAFRRSLSSRPYDSVARYQLGYVLFKSSDYSWTGEIWDKALVEFRRAHELGLNDEMVFDQMALIFEKKMDYDRSIEMSEKSFHIYPENLNIAANLAYWLSIREKDLGRADSLSRRAVVAAPGHPLYWWTRGLVLEKLGRYRESLDALGKVPARLGNIKNGAAYEAELGMDIDRVRRLNSRKT
jgi:tetratricopeptide (TPR) repeat protein